MRAAVLAVFVLLVAAPARGAEVTVVLEPARTPALEKATARVPADLVAAGYQLSTDCAPALDAGCAQAWPSGVRAVAGVGFAWATEGLAILARVARADRRTVRLETLVAGGEAPEPSLVAVRTAELVRAGVLAVLREPATVERSSSASDAGALGLRVAVGPALVASVAGLGAAMGLSVEAALTWRRDWSAGAWALPTLASSANTIEGGARVRHDLLGLQLARGWRPTSVIRASIGAGAGAYHLRVEGQDVAPLVAATDQLWTPFLAGGGALGVALGPSLSLLVDVRAVFTRTAALVRVGASEAGRSGRPLLVAALAVVYAP